jgi:hypothetical protein
VLGAVWPERTSKLRVAGSIPAGRTIPDVLLPDGTNVNHQLVKDGWCWWYKRYAPGEAELERLETEAREAKKGLWADPHPVPPWEWRKRQVSANERFVGSYHESNINLLDRWLFNPRWWEGDSYRKSIAKLKNPPFPGASSTVDEWLV